MGQQHHRILSVLMSRVYYTLYARVAYRQGPNHSLVTLLELESGREMFLLQ